jgi:hypothetical protein
LWKTNNPKKPTDKQFKVIIFQVSSYRKEVLKAFFAAEMFNQNAKNL